MMARRGQSRSIYSDNGTKECELRSMVKKLNESEDLQNRLTRIGEGICWKFQPPASRHWGGVHESLVKSVKRALYRTINPNEKTKRSNPTDLQLSALFAEVERFVNPRPISSTEAFRKLFVRLLIKWKWRCDAVDGFILDLIRILNDVHEGLYNLKEFSDEKAMEEDCK
ncbi:uncharacterized protein LOC110238700 [Paramuricea clavata]|uniref:Uncharacterized protein LOC110238700 n=1 Tax=Paramuricea clavata TaxID=317549 RepID=A0A7D9IPL6_PARCT|nr:uncharacterized protein LOC110238700 [Paramuricea clavata]